MLHFGQEVVGKAGAWLIMNMDIFEYLNQECVPALGCTEPASIAYAGMTAAKQITGAPTSLTLTIDPRIYKNCHSQRAVAQMLGTAGNFKNR
jgi:L-cysteine desulfidase